MSNDEGMTKSEVTLDEDAPWLEDKIAVLREEGGNRPVFDLEERTARFGEAIIDFAKKIPSAPFTERIISQLVGAGTSVGANYDEADDAVSKKGIPEVHRHMQKRSARANIFCGWPPAPFRN